MLTDAAKKELEKQKSKEQNSLGAQNSENFEQPKMISELEKKNLEKQQYRIVGEHSTVKICGWTKSVIRGKGGCYKLKFYGIMSNQCMQMTTSISCANRCTFCWRGYKAPVSKEWKWKVDDPDEILKGSLEAHHKLLVGFRGSKEAHKGAYEKSKTVRHVALSLTGEPIIYPKINEFIDLCHKERISTFMVTNAQYPEAIKNLRPVTQLYISMDAPNKELLKKVDVPLFKDFWERFNESLDIMAKRKDRTCIRITQIKGINDIEPENYAKLIEKASPDFVEVKSYMHVGPSRERLKRENMPLHEEVVEFTNKIVKFLPDYEIVSEQISSRVIMLAKKHFKKGKKWYTWIDFDKFFELYKQNKVNVDDFLLPTPKTGISGKGTLDLAKERQEEGYS